MRFVYKIMFPIYAVYRSRRDFSSEGASTTTKGWSAIVLAVAFSFLANIIYYLFISKPTYNKYRILFDNDKYLFCCISIYLVVAYLKKQEWEEMYDNYGYNLSDFVTTLFICIVIVFFNALLSAHLHQLFK